MKLNINFYCQIFAPIHITVNKSYYRQKPTDNHCRRDKVKFKDLLVSHANKKIRTA